MNLMLPCPCGRYSFSEVTESSRTRPAMDAFELACVCAALNCEGVGDEGPRRKLSMWAAGLAGRWRGCVRCVHCLLSGSLAYQRNGARALARRGLRRIEVCSHNVTNCVCGE